MKEYQQERHATKITPKDIMKSSMKIKYTMGLHRNISTQSVYVKY
jgi:hypothetical protein